MSPAVAVPRLDELYERLFRPLDELLKQVPRIYHSLSGADTGIDGFSFTVWFSEDFSLRARFCNDGTCELMHSGIPSYFPRPLRLSLDNGLWRFANDFLDNFHHAHPQSETEEKARKILAPCA
ncbi:MAG: hypothetical protein UY65_C0023G0015 [Parcubacteria group bacterium GW2011_GWA2_51_12]|nr:MAG: hypothetical protein UY65_C0023G0015 [Parcubacteria group bacterium GW2011_GWA2_51_12]